MTPAVQVGWTDDGQPLMKDDSCRKFERWLAALETPAQCSELRALIVDHPTLTAERRAFFGRCLNLTARLSLGFRFDSTTGTYHEGPLSPTHE